MFDLLASDIVDNIEFIESKHNNFFSTRLL